MSKNLIIGNSSQLSYYFPQNYEKISSRNININHIQKQYYNRIFLTFAEQRTYLDKPLEFFTEINVDYTISIINKVINNCDSLVIYATSELWNKYDGCIKLEHSYNYNFTNYIKSKEILCNEIRSSDIYNKVLIVYPFNFNSIYRTGNFLFSKIFNSIKYDKKISVGHINFYRDITHPKIITKKSIETNTDIIIGSGFLVNIQEFISDMYALFNKNFMNYIQFDNNCSLNSIRGNYYSCSKTTDYKSLLKLYAKEILIDSRCTNY